ncbi:MAG: hypothetical protein HQL23_05405 [Candidatus Omnitrophica bacterium]|nr:hypothetical protein [Candidatus Omnitrophota bacterium]
MKRTIFMLIGLCFVTSLAFAQAKPAAPAAAPAAVAPAAVAAPADVTLKGVIIDNQCAGGQKPENLAAFIKTHTKECALMPACVASGYSIFVDGKLLKFDAASNAKIADFLKKADSKLAVDVVAKNVKDELSLVSVENQKEAVK